MDAVRRQSDAVRGWWPALSRALALGLALMLALALSAPTGLAADLAYHQAAHGSDQVQLATGSDATADGAQSADPGLGCHIHCGCHVAATPVGAMPSPRLAAIRPHYARLSAVVPSRAPDRLPRPPRARV